MSFDAVVVALALISASAIAIGLFGNTVLIASRWPMRSLVVILRKKRSKRLSGNWRR